MRSNTIAALYLIFLLMSCATKKDNKPETATVKERMTIDTTSITTNNEEIYSNFVAKLDTIQNDYKERNEFPCDFTLESIASKTVEALQICYNISDPAILNRSIELTLNTKVYKRALSTIFSVRLVIEELKNKASSNKTSETAAIRKALIGSKFWDGGIGAYGSLNYFLFAAERVTVFTCDNPDNRTGETKNIPYTLKIDESGEIFIELNGMKYKIISNGGSKSSHNLIEAEVESPTFWFETESECEA